MPRYLFVVGQARSGTTALARVIGSHPEIVLGLERYKRLIPPERLSAYVPALFTREQFFDFSTELTNLTPDAGPRFAAWYDRLTDKFDTATYLGDKLTDPAVIPALAQQFPDSKFICIVRDVFEVAHSWQVRADDPSDRWGAQRGALKAVNHWNRAVETIAEASEQLPGRVLTVDYTAFFGASNDAPLEPIAHFLGVPIDGWRSEYAAARQKYAMEIVEKPRDLDPEVAQHIQNTLRSDLLQAIGQVRSEQEAAFRGEAH